jgi:hypothetical protein
MNVNIDHLEKVLSILLAELKVKKSTLVELKGDFFWDIAPEELYDPYNDPHTFTLGQLSDDIDRMERILTTKESVPYDIKRMACLLIALSYENPI